MKSTTFKLAAKAMAAAVASVLVQTAQAAIVITEVDAAGSSAAYNADWFELTNTGSTAVNISGWKMDDNSNAFVSAVALRGVTSIAAGQSVVFVEGNSTGSTDAAINAAFVQAWFGGNAPGNLLIGNYGGSGVGLGTSGDAVNIFTSTGSLVTRVDLAASTLGRSFDNAAGLNNTTLSTFSTAGVNGARLSANGIETGSPGTIAAVPEPESVVLMLTSLGMWGLARARRRQA